MTIQIGIIGATGYTGVELLRLLANHPEARVRVLTSRQEAGKAVTRLFPSLRGYYDSLVFSLPDDPQLLSCDVVFFATPHATALHSAENLLQNGVRVIDLSADFRLKDAALWAKWYGEPHVASHLLQDAVYGLPEMQRAAIKQARLIAVPGCYPTAVQLGFLPLIAQQWVELDSLIADCKSGVSGAGRSAKIPNLFAESSDNFKAYGLHGHRHLPEILQGLQSQIERFSEHTLPTTAVTKSQNSSLNLVFSPHLTPMVRGIHATLYARLRPEFQHLDNTALHQAFLSQYNDEPFVDVLPLGEYPETRSVRGSNVCRLNVLRAPDSPMVIVTSVIDNLVKGAAGQAIQAMNIACDLPERTGLMALPLSP